MAITQEIRFVQFLHPGGEGPPGATGWKASDTRPTAARLSLSLATAAMDRSSIVLAFGSQITGAGLGF
jgi:hypothetical protein